MTTAGSLSDSGTSNPKVTTFTGSQTLPGSRSLNSLNLLSTGAGTLVFGAGNLLNLTSGGLLRSGNFTASIGASADSGSLTAGGAAGSVPLYLYNNANTLTLNSRIINNPAGGALPLQLVLAGAGTVTLASGSNSYTGGTVVDSIPLTLAATGRLPSGGLTLNGANFTQLAGGVIEAANVLTLNGSLTATLVGANTLAGLAFNNSGGGGTAPTLVPGSILTLTGGVTATSSNPASSATVSAASVLDFGTLAASISAGPVLFNGADLAPLVPSLILAGPLRGSGGLNLTGNGVLQLGTLSAYTGTTTVSGSSALQIGATGAGSPQSQLILADAGSRLNLNNFSTVLGGLAGAGIVTNSGTSAATLTTGYDGSSGTFSGSFARFSDAYASSLNITKVGTGMLSLTGTSTSAGTLVVNQGGITYLGTGRSGFLANTLAASSSLVLDNSATNTNNRLGGSVVTGGTGATLTLGGGSLTLIGNASAPTVESLGAYLPLTGGSLVSGSSLVTVASTAGLLPGMVVSGTGITSGTTILAITGATTLTLSGTATASNTGLALQTGSLGTLTPSLGGSTLTLAPNAAQSLAFYTGTFGGVTAGASLLLRGGSLGATLGTGVANLVALTAAPTLIGGAGAAASVTMSIRPDILADTSASGFGAGFATYVGAAGTYTTGGTGFRPLVGNFTGTTELASYMTAGATANIGLFNVLGSTIAGATTINSLTLASGSNYNVAGQFPDFFALTPTSGGILATSGTSTLSGGQIAAPGTGMFFWTPGASTVLNLNSTVTGGNAFTKDGAGNLVVGVRQLYTGATNLNGGTLTLSGGDNRLFVNALGTGYALNVNAGVLDLGTTSQTVAALSNSNATPGSGGTITGGSSAVFTATAAGVFAGMLAGSLNFTRAGNNNTTLLSDNTFTGATVIRGGSLILQQGGRLSATAVAC